MEVMIGIDPHKRSHTAAMLDWRQRELRQLTVCAGRRQVVELLEWADGAQPRTWAVESAGGMGYGQVDRSGDAWGEWHGEQLAALAQHGQSAAAAFLAERFDVGADRLRHAQPVQRQQ